MKEDSLKVFVGYDTREDVAWQVCKHSLEARNKNLFDKIVELARKGNLKLSDIRRHPDVLKLNNNKPVMFETVKNAIEKKLGKTTLNKIKKSVKIPVVAIGGINHKNYKKLLLNKADFLAISGYIWNNKKFKPHQAIKNLI